MIMCACGASIVWVKDKASLQESLRCDCSCHKAQQ